MMKTRDKKKKKQQKKTKKKKKKKINFKKHIIFYWLPFSSSNSMFAIKAFYFLDD